MDGDRFTGLAFNTERQLDGEVRDAGAFALNGVHNVFIGTASGLKSETTWGNVNIGYRSGFNTTTGSANRSVAV